MVQHPALRAEIVSALEALADPAHQQRVWVERRMPSSTYHDDLDANVHILYDDTGVLPDPEAATGVFLADAAELEAVRAVGVAFDPLLADLGDEPDRVYLADPRWPDVVAAAARAVAVLRSAVTPDRLFDALVAVVPDLSPLRDEHLADHGDLLGHVLMGEVVGWCEDHVGDRRTEVVRIGAIVADALERGDEATVNIALVSFSEGIHPGTPLWEVVPVALRDTWSGPASAEASAPSPVAGVSYCERWDPVAHSPVDVLDEAAARARFADGPWFTVVVPREDGSPVPDAVLEVEAGLTTVTVLFFAADGTLDDTYVYRRRGDRLFLAVATALAYAEGGRGLTACVRHDLVVFAADGTTDHVVDERGEQGVGLARGRTDAVDTNWEPLPVFGQWAGLARFER